MHPGAAVAQSPQLREERVVRDRVERPVAVRFGDGYRRVGFELADGGRGRLPWFDLDQLEAGRTQLCLEVDFGGIARRHLVAAVSARAPLDDDAAVSRPRAKDGAVPASGSAAAASAGATASAAPTASRTPASLIDW